MLSTLSFGRLWVPPPPPPLQLKQKQLDSSVKQCGFHFLNLHSNFYLRLSSLILPRVFSTNTVCVRVCVLHTILPVPLVFGSLLSEPREVLREQVGTSVQRRPHRLSANQ